MQCQYQNWVNMRVDPGDSRVFHSTVAAGAPPEVEEHITKQKLHRRDPKMTDWRSLRKKPRVRERPLPRQT